MNKQSQAPSADDPFGLHRFILAQEGEYFRALAELKRGRKESHWIWFIFPQIEGLGHSPTSRYFAIRSLEEARQYLAHPVLGPRLNGCCEAVLALPTQLISNIFGPPDDLKFRSSMTLFAQAAGHESVFGKLLNKFFGGHLDERTLEILRQLAKGNPI